MKNVARVLFILFLFFELGWSQRGSQQDKSNIIVVLQTELGTIELAIDCVHAPVTAKNFMKYVDGKFYDGGRFFRTVTMDNQPKDKVKIEVIQGDIDSTRRKDVFPPIELERASRTGLVHKNGALSMARGTPNTATSSFFICINDQPELNLGGKRNPDGQGFAAFGTVIKGMDVVKKIQTSPAEGQSLKPPIKILSARRK